MFLMFYLMDFLTFLSLFDLKDDSISMSSKGIRTSVYKLTVSLEIMSTFSKDHI